MQAFAAVIVAALAVLASAYPVDKLTLLNKHFPEHNVNKMHDVVKDRLYQQVVNGGRVRPIGVNIVGGEEVDPPFKYEFMASLQTSSGHFCGGSLLNSSWVLTAAHCSTGVNARNVEVHLHRHQITLSDSQEDGIVAAVDEILIHPDYRSLTIDHDVALWHLSEPVTSLATIQIDTTGQFTVPGDDTIVTGWGYLQENGRLATTLQEVTVPIATDAACEESYPRQITENMVCAGLPEGGKDSCQGDSGGPLFSLASGVPVQVGIVSWGTGCARPDYYGVYTRVHASSITDFILETVN